MLLPVFGCLLCTKYSMSLVVARCIFPCILSAKEKLRVMHTTEIEHSEHAFYKTGRVWIMLMTPFSAKPCKKLDWLFTRSFCKKKRRTVAFYMTKRVNHSQAADALLQNLVKAGPDFLSQLILAFFAKVSFPQWVIYLHTGSTST